MAFDNNAPAGWKNLEDFRDGLSTNLQSPSHDLDGTIQDFVFNEIGAANQPLQEGSEVTLRLAINGEQTGLTKNGKIYPCGVRCFYTDVDTYFISCCMIEPENEDFNIFFNLKTRRALGIYAAARKKPVPGECRVVQTYMVGYLEGGVPSGFKPERTRDLIGQRLLIVYDDDHYYEQIFLNSGRYCWHNLKGEQYGDAASETCDFFKFDDQLYVYSWRELLIPCGTSYFLNYKNRTAVGKFIGWTSNGTISHSFAGGDMLVLSTTTYPPQCRPK
jgi:hypothetical protein